MSTYGFTATIHILGLLPFHSNKLGEGEEKLSTPQPCLTAVACSTITLKAGGGRWGVEEREGGVVEADQPVRPAMHHEVCTAGLQKYSP